MQERREPGPDAGLFGWKCGIAEIKGCVILDTLVLFVLRKKVCSACCCSHVHFLDKIQGSWKQASLDRWSLSLGRLGTHRLWLWIQISHFHLTRCAGCDSGGVTVLGWTERWVRPWLREPRSWARSKGHKTIARNNRNNKAWLMGSTGDAEKVKHSRSFDSDLGEQHEARIYPIATILCCLHWSWDFLKVLSGRRHFPEARKQPSSLPA